MAAPKEKRLFNATRSDGSLDYMKLEKPTVIRRQAEATQPYDNRKADTNYLDIPAFLRRREGE